VVSGGASSGKRATRAVLVVASWFPSVDSLSSGQFVADQVAALRTEGRYTPLVASFDPASLWGSGSLRRREAAAVRAQAGAGLAAFPDRTFRPWDGRPGRDIPVARLMVSGPARGAGSAERPVTERAERLECAASAVDGIAGPPSVLHAHTGYPDGAAAALEASRRGIPLVITEHATYLAGLLADPVRRARYRAGGLTAARVIAVGGVLADQIRTELPEIADRVVVIPNMVDADAFIAPGLEPRRDDEILFVGFRKRAKGIALLLEAFALARVIRPALRLRLIGAAPAASLDAEWRRQAEALGIRDAVVFEPEMDRGGVAAAMARATMFVHPSARETFGVVAAEALVAGRPVVAVDSGGVPEVLGPDPDENGAIVPPGDPRRLADAIVRVYDRRDDYRPEVLRDRAIARFGPAAVASRIADLYDEVIAETSRTGQPAGGARVSARAPDSRGTVAQTPAQASSDHGPIVVVALDRVRATRVLAAVPPADRARVRLVTAAAALPELPDVLDTVSEVAGLEARHVSLRAILEASSPSSGRSRRRALATQPMVLLRELRQRLPGRERTLLARAREALASVTTPGASLVALDGFDALVAEPAVREGLLVPLPGAGRWLAGGGIASGSGSIDGARRDARAPEGADR
jgi:glycosyltransferase involved in cell wall biosynthesis